MSAPQAYDDRDGFIWYNGKLTPWREAKLHVLSHGLHYGGSVFEGERSYDGKIFKLREHSERLIRSADMLGMTIPYTAEELDAATIETMKANNIVDGYFRPFAWRGSEQMAVSAQLARVHVAIACWTWPKYFFPKGGEEAGIALMTTHWRRPDPRTAPVHSKAAGNYAVGTMAKHEAENKGFDDVLMLDYRGYVAESSGSNIFIVKGGKISTPVADCFLNGITRQTIVQLARDLGYDVTERVVMPDEIPGADEIFVTGTAAEVTSVGRIDEHKFPYRGPVTRHLQDAYHNLVHGREPARRSA